MRQALPIFKKEFFGYFRTPVAFVFLAVFHLLAATLTFFAGGFFDGNEASLASFFTFLPWLFSVFIPAVAMRLWAEERRSGTLELVFTLPVSTAEAVLGKFLAAWAFISIAIVLTFPFVLTIAYLGDPDWGILFASYLGCILMAGGYLGVSSFTSALTRNQVIAWVLGVIGSLFLTLIGWNLFSGLLESVLPVPVVDAITNFGFITHFQSMTRGLIELRGLVFFISLIAVTLPLTALVLKHGVARALITAMLVAIVAALFIGLVSLVALVFSIPAATFAGIGTQLLLIALFLGCALLGLKARWLPRAVTAGLLLVAALAELNYIGAVLPARIDMTAGNMFTLSVGTKQLLGKIEEPVALKLYFSRSTQGLPIQYKNFASRVEEMLRQYVDLSKGRLSLETIDPQPDTEEEAAAQRSGLTGQPLPSGEQVFFGLVATQGAEEKSIPFIALNREPFLEYDLSQLVYSVQQVDKPKLGLLTGLPLKAPAFAMPGQRQQPDQLVVGEWEKTFEVVSIEETADELPANLDVLAIIHPQNVSEKLQFAIDQFLLAGKPVFLAVDPSSLLMRSQQRQQQQMFGGPQPGVSSDLPRLLKAWGVNYNASSLVGDLDLARPAQTASGVVNYPIWLDIKAAQLSSDVLPTSSLKSMLLIEAGSIEVAKDRGYEVTPLIQSTTRAGDVASMLLQFTPPDKMAAQIKPTGEKKDLAVMIRGSFKTAFPEGAPKDEKPEDAAKEGETPPAEPAPAADAPPAFKESIAPGTLVIIADSDWLLDSYSVDTRFLRAGMVVPANDNLAFAGNTIDFLGGSRDLISIRSKGVTQRQFDVIRNLERAAQEKYQAALEELEGRLNTIQQDLNKLLQTERAESRQIVLTPEMSAKVKEFQDQQVALRAQRRDIRRALREDIESLQNRLTLFNLAGVPFLVCIAGVIVLLPRYARLKHVLHFDAASIEVRLARHAAVAAALLAVATGVWMFNRPPPRLELDARVGQSVLDQAQLKGVASVVITSGGKTVTLANTSSDPAKPNWVVREYSDMPIDYSKLVRLLGELSDAKVLRFVTADPERAGRLDFGDASIELRDASDATVWKASLGKPTDTSARFIKFNDEAKVFLASINPYLDTTPKNWADAVLVKAKADDVLALQVGLPDGTAMTLQRENATAKWTADGLAADEQVKESTVRSLLSKFTSLRFTETTEPDNADAVAARENARTYKVALADGRSYTIDLGRRPAPPAPPPPPAPAEGEEAKASPAPEAPKPGPVFAFVRCTDESEPINSLMAKRAFQIGEWTYNDLPASRDALVEKAPPPPPPPTPAPAEEPAAAPEPTPPATP